MAACMVFPASFLATLLKAAPYGLNEAQIGLISMGATLTFTLSAAVAGSLDAQFGGAGLLVLGDCLAALGYFVNSALPPFCLLPQTLLCFMLGMYLVFAGVGVVLAAATPLCTKLAESAGHSEEAAAAQTTSMYVFGFSLAGMLAPPLGGVLAQSAGPRWANAAAGGLALCAVLPLLGMHVRGTPSRT
eukprot:6487632-Prymnesium_polylepis.1